MSAVSDLLKYRAGYQKWQEVEDYIYLSASQRRLLKFKSRFHGYDNFDQSRCKRRHVATETRGCHGCVG